MTTDRVTDQLIEAASLMGVGMLVVFVFLTLLIGALHLLTWLCKRIPQNNKQSTPDTESSQSASTNVPGAHVAAISAAMVMHRNSSQ